MSTHNIGFYEELTKKYLSIIIKYYQIHTLLSGQASVNRSKSKEKCPFGCDDRVDSGAMWIGKAPK